MLRRTLVKQSRSRTFFSSSLLMRVLPSFCGPFSPLPFRLPVSSTRACSSSSFLYRRRISTLPSSKSTTSSSCAALRMTSDRSRALAAPTPIFSTQAIPLTRVEQDIFELLKRVLVDEKLDSLTLRVAGGWVRDKILSRDMKEVDIDIALDTLLGREFAEIVNSWMTKQSLKTTSVGVIHRNPDQSKHLETARMRILDVWIDLVNLRTETYSHDSRIPDVKIGTPYEDAMRRDLTINALFYNINTSAIEDFTGKGFDDIRARIVRTPLPPLTTLLDDPLRALRAIRFASRLNFSFDPALYDACRNQMVHEALGAKVSRERICTEVDSILASPRALHAVGLLVELGLFPIVFRLPSSNSFVDLQRPPEGFPYAALGSLMNLAALWELTNERCITERPPENLVRIANYAATLAPLIGVKCMHADGRREKPAPVVRHILANQLRMSAKDVHDVCAIHDAAIVFKQLVNSAVQKPQRLDVASAMRIAGPLWRIALQISVVMELSPARAAASYARGTDAVPPELAREAQTVVKKYTEFAHVVNEMKLDGVWELKPLINGKLLMDLLPAIRKGPVIGEIMKQQLDLLVEQPNLGKEDVQNWILKEYQHLTSKKT